MARYTNINSIQHKQKQNLLNVEIKTIIIKNITMKNIINLFILILIISSFSCKAQTVATLQQMEECRKRPKRGVEPCPGMENVTHVKDTENRLDKFVGIWKGTFNGKQVELKLEKKGGLW